jgi:hypothetical protein
MPATATHNHIHLYMQQSLLLLANLYVKWKWCDSVKLISNNDKLERFARGLYIQQKEGERELDCRETESVWAWEAEHWDKGQVASVLSPTIRT